MARHVILLALLVYGIAAGAALLFEYVVNRDARKLRRTIFHNLDAAAENGYFEPGEQLHTMSADEIAYDMVCYVGNLEHVASGSAAQQRIVPYVREWLKLRQRTDHVTEVFRGHA